MLLKDNFAILRINKLFGFDVRLKIILASHFLLDMKHLLLAMYDSHHVAGIFSFISAIPTMLLFIANQVQWQTSHTHITTESILRRMK